MYYERCTLLGNLKSVTAVKSSKSDADSSLTGFTADNKRVEAELAKKATALANTASSSVKKEPAAAAEKEEKGKAVASSSDASSSEGKGKAKGKAKSESESEAESESDASSSKSKGKAEAKGKAESESESESESDASSIEEVGHVEDPTANVDELFDAKVKVKTEAGPAHKNWPHNAKAACVEADEAKKAADAVADAGDESNSKDESSNSKEAKADAGEKSDPTPRRSARGKKRRLV